MGWSAFSVGQWWPLWLAPLTAVLLAVFWYKRRGSLFPDVRLLSRTASAAGFIDRAPLLLGGLVVALLLLSLMDLSVSRSMTIDRRARDYLLVVDTSRSMRENSQLLRESFPPTYPRKAGLYSGDVEDPTKIPQLARYELARESLLDFLSAREADDRVGLVYFNSEVFLMSGFTSNLQFVENQLAGMDPFVTHGTNIRWALGTGLDLIERYPSDNRRAIVLLTDAEVRNTRNLQRELSRLSELDVAFYLLWITTDEEGGVSDQAREFLRSVRSVGGLYKIEDVSEGSLAEALADIGELEDYSYQELRHERIDLSRYLFVAARWLMLAWILLVATIYHPVSASALVGERS